ncbi:MAG: phosphatidate cytidylyltransferase [bacterium]
MSGSNHVKRVLTSALLLPILVAAVLFGRGIPFNLLILACVLKGMAEFHTITEKGGSPGFRKGGMVLGFLLTLAFMLRAPLFILLVLTGCVIALFFACLASPRPFSESVPRISGTLLGLVYVPLMMGFLILIRGLEGGAYLVFLLLAIIWTGDTMAYYIGSLVGRHSMCPTISPKKTVEGMVGGLAGSAIAALILGRWWFPAAPLAFHPLMGLAVGCFGQLGDLSESILKRWAGVKESGNILPGHGGLLDRIDGLIFSAPVFYCCIIFAPFARGG